LGSVASYQTAFAGATDGQGGYLLDCGVVLESALKSELSHSAQKSYTNFIGTESTENVPTEMHVFVTAFLFTNSTFANHVFSTLKTAAQNCKLGRHEIGANLRSCFTVICKVMNCIKTGIT